ncbi:ETC complex I subunit [Afifella pfennigii]|uniref:ETC complex I subunit n=1 Tax=Afifella pfennigii TaxID=209897 RepID=UPI00047BEAE1|nr:ETC complex I subunit [Afifella pfennigii]
MQARIFRPARTAMSSGEAKTRQWVLEFEPEARRSIEPLMGYTASADMRAQVRLRFPTKEEAIAYAERNNIAYRLFEPKEKKRASISYSDNFRYNRQVPWTH